MFNLFKKKPDVSYSIGIVTFDKRFENYFKPLITSIKEYRPDVEIIVSVNGNLKSKNQNYRREILEFLSSYDNVYPSLYTNFRSLSKLWNNTLINSSNHNLLLLNDDVTITSSTFFDQLECQLKLDPTASFKINSSWSHVLLNRLEVDKVGWFDERLLGVGEEDGDFEWRWELSNKKPFISKQIDSIINHVEQNDVLDGLKIANTKYSKFNLNFIHEKYKVDKDGFNYGIMGKKLICINPTPSLHKVEDFYWRNRIKL